jgi:hypothetical protein
MATGNAVMAFPELVYVDSALEAAHCAHVVLVVTAWPEFGKICPGAVSAAVASRIVVDACQGSPLRGGGRLAGWQVLSLAGDHVGHPADDPAADPRPEEPLIRRGGFA